MECSRNADGTAIVGLKWGRPNEDTDSVSAHHLAEQARKEYDDAQQGAEAARRRLKEAEDRLVHTCDIYFEMDLKRDCSWNKMYYQLVAYKAKNDGDVLVPTTKDSPAEVKKLAKWVQNQVSDAHIHCY